MATQLSQKRAFDQPPIPDRLYFKIGDVARICDVQTYVLRFWETQFPHLKPNKSGTGQRLYRRRDVEIALEIKRLVHSEGYTLAGARQALDQARRTDAERLPQRDSLRDLSQDLPADLQPRLPLPGMESSGRPDAAAAIGLVQAELREIARLLASPASTPPRRRSRLAAKPDAEVLLFPS
jgi:DNA-binding transcriptional MerR regulator